MPSRRGLTGFGLAVAAVTAALAGTAGPAEVSDWTLLVAHGDGRVSAHVAGRSEPRFEIASGADTAQSVVATASGETAWVLPAFGSGGRTTVTEVRVSDGAIARRHTFECRYPGELAIGDDDHLWVGCGGRLLRLAPDDGRMVERLSLDGDRLAVALHPDRKKMLIVGNESTKLSWIDPHGATRHRAAELDLVDARGLAVSPSGEVAWVADAGAGAVLEVTLPSLAPGVRLPLPGRPARITWTGDGRRAAVTTTTPPAVHVIDVATRAIRSLDLEAPPAAIVASPTGELFVSLPSRGRVVRVDPERAVALEGYDSGVLPLGLAIVRGH